MTSNIDNFIKETNKKIEAMTKRQNSRARQIILGAYDTLTSLSPVDKGLYKNNHIITVNQKTKNTKELKENNNSKYSLNSAEFKNNDTIYIQNNLAYAQALENGHSKQAPLGIYSVTEEITKDIIERIKL